MTPITTLLLTDGTTKQPSSAFLRKQYTECAEMVNHHNPLNLSDLVIIKPYLELFIFFIRSNFPEELTIQDKLHQFTDLSAPHLWFPQARQIKRKIIFHAGPTNSGKTYNALEALKSGKSGIYCAPLRLLAWEVGT